VDAAGGLVPLAEQDRSRWDAGRIAEGVALVSGSLAGSPLGTYQVQAAIAAVHAEAPGAAGTDWPQILGLYDLLQIIAPGPMVTLNRIVAVAMVHGDAVALAALDQCAADPVLARSHRVPAVRAHLLERSGERTAAAAAYREAARGTLSVPEQRYLQGRAAALD
jgi:predicted RNA polymerase sigma factor